MEFRVCDQTWRTYSGGNPKKSGKNGGKKCLCLASWLTGLLLLCVGVIVIAHYLTSSPMGPSVGRYDNKTIITQWFGMCQFCFPNPYHPKGILAPLNIIIQILFIIGSEWFCPKFQLFCSHFCVFDQLLRPFTLWIWGPKTTKFMSLAVDGG